MLGFVIFDLCYYFFHRYSHEINFLWAAHVVHHQSEEYNLSVALRQSWIQQIFSGIFYLPLALIGLPVEMFFLLNALNTLYQFWIHTRLINTIGPLEWLINTPAHHRVHHGVDDHYVDKNYAGVFIIWDRMFGTFIQEEERPNYGVIKPLRSWNPAWANFDIWHLMWSRIQSKTLTLGERLSVPFRTPAWRGALEAPPNMILRTDDRYTLYDHRSSYMRYIIVLGGINVGTSMWVVSQSTTTSLQDVLIWVGAHLFAGISLHALLEERSWGLWVERLRLLLLPVLAYYIPLNSTPLSSTLSSLSIECSLYTFMSICSLIILAQRPPPQIQSSLIPSQKPLP